MNELISIVVPIYNVENYIHRCIDSIIKQTYRNLEIILVDDGSPDKCSQICDEYARLDDRIKVIHKKNGGLSDARNAGIEIATGEYIGFIDSDDWIEIDMFEHLYNLVKKHHANISICGRNFVSNKIISTSKQYGKEFIYTAEEAINEILLPRKFNTSVTDKLFKKTLFNEIRFPYGKLHEDQYVLYKLLYLGETIVYSSAPKYNVYIREGSITNSKFSRARLDDLEACQERMSFIKNKYPHLINNAKVNYFIINLNLLYDMRKSAYKDHYTSRILKYNLIKNLYYIISSKHLKVKSKLVFLFGMMNIRIDLLYKKIFLKSQKL